MTQSAAILDRYLSFEGLDCDERAVQLMQRVRAHLAREHTPWCDYFEARFAVARQRGEDDLYLVGSQVNPLRELFADYDDEEGMELLEALEEECC